MYDKALDKVEGVVLGDKKSSAKPLILKLIDQGLLTKEHLVNYENIFKDKDMGLDDIMSEVRTDLEIGRETALTSATARPTKLLNLEQGKVEAPIDEEVADEDLTQYERDQLQVQRFANKITDRKAETARLEQEEADRLALERQEVRDRVAAKKLANKPAPRGKKTITPEEVEYGNEIAKQRYDDFPLASLERNQKVKLNIANGEDLTPEEITDIEDRVKFEDALKVSERGDYMASRRNEELGAALANNTNNTLQVLAKSKNPVVSWVAKKAARIPKLKVQLADKGTFDYYEVPEEALGFYDPSDKLVGIRIDAISEEHVVTHELMHALTMEGIDNPTAMQKPAVERINKLYETVKNDPSLKGFYGISDVHEFVSEGFSDPEFQYRLSKIKYGNSNAWEKFTQFIANLLGIQKSNALVELMSATESLIDSTDYYTEGGKASGIKYSLSPTEQVSQTAREARTKDNIPVKPPSTPFYKNIAETISNAETKYLSYDAKFINTLRGAIKALGLPVQAMQKLMLQASQSQTVQATATAGAAAVQGDIKYNPNSLNWEAVDGEHAMPKVRRLVEEIAKAKGESFATINKIFSDIMVASRLAEIYKKADDIMAKARAEAQKLIS